MDEMKNRRREERLRVVVNELDANPETAEFARARADNETTGFSRATSLPLPEDEAQRRQALLVEHLGFTSDEASRFVAGDRSAIEAVASRRLAANERETATADPIPRGSAPSAS